MPRNANRRRRLPETGTDRVLHVEAPPATRATQVIEKLQEALCPAAGAAVEVVPAARARLGVKRHGMSFLHTWDLGDAPAGDGLGRLGAATVGVGFGFTRVGEAKSVASLMRLIRLRASAAIGKPLRGALAQEHFSLCPMPRLR